MAEWLLSRPDRVPADPRDIWRAVESHRLGLPPGLSDDALRVLRGVAQPYRAAAAATIDWLMRRNHACGGSQPVADAAALARAICRTDPRLRRPLALAWCWCGGDLDAAEQMISGVYWERRPLAALETIIAAASALQGATP